MAAARRRTQVLRKLDDPIRLAGVISARSATLLAFCAFFFLYSEVTLRAFSGLLGRSTGLATMFGLIAAVAGTLLWAERHEDEHLVPSLLRYYASGRWRGVFSAGVVAPYRRPSLRPLAVVLELRALGVRRSS